MRGWAVVRRVVDAAGERHRGALVPGADLSADLQPRTELLGDFGVDTVRGGRLVAIVDTGALGMAEHGRRRAVDGYVPQRHRRLPGPREVGKAVTGHPRVVRLLGVLEGNWPAATTVEGNRLSGPRTAAVDQIRVGEPAAADRGPLRGDPGSRIGGEQGCAEQQGENETVE